MEFKRCFLPRLDPSGECILQTKMLLGRKRWSYQNERLVREVTFRGSPSKSLPKASQNQLKKHSGFIENMIAFSKISWHFDVFSLSNVSSPGIEVTLDNMPNNGVILVVTDAGSKQLDLERSITKKSLEKNIKIFFTFYPSCRADCDERDERVYERLSDGETFNSSEFTSEKFFSTVITKVCHNSAGFR